MLAADLPAAEDAEGGDGAAGAEDAEDAEDAVEEEDDGANDVCCLEQLGLFEDGALLGPCVGPEAPAGALDFLFRGVLVILEPSRKQ